MGMVGEACLPSNAYYPRTPDYTLCSGVHVCWSEHSDSSFVYGFMILNYGFGTMTATTFDMSMYGYRSILESLGLRDNENRLYMTASSICCRLLNVSGTSWHNWLWLSRFSIIIYNKTHANGLGIDKCLGSLSPFWYLRKSSCALAGASGGSWGVEGGS